MSVQGLPRVTPLRGLPYQEFLHLLHRRWSISRYLEIGTHTGLSLGRATGEAVAIDPKFMLDKAAWSARPGTHLFEMTSDTFFAGHDPVSVLGGAVELAFIDGLHQAECVLRDFVNIERCCEPASTIVVHDVLPRNFAMTERVHRPSERLDRALALDWTGDVWRFVPLLVAARPDLDVRILDCPPTGLLLVSNLDPRSSVLAEQLDDLVGTLTARPPDEEEFWSFIERARVSDSRAIIAPR